MAQRGINKAIIVGNLGADPDVRYTAGGTAVTNINVATSDTWRDKSSGDMQERTEWHRIVFFARLAEVAGDYLKKGAKVYVEGRIKTRKWQGQDGQDRYTTEIVGNEMQMLDTRGGAGGQAKAESQAQNAGRNGGSAKDYANASRGGGPAQTSGAPAGSNDDLDDDIPFGPVPWWAI